MRKFLIVVCAILLSILAFSTIPALGIKTAQATQGAGVFCPNNYQSSVDNPDEIQTSTNICEDIAMFLYMHYYPGPVYSFEGDPFNSIDVNPSNYSDTLSTLQQTCDSVTVFSKGHCVPWGYNGEHYELLCTEPYTFAQDATTIWSSTDACTTRFCFIWHCGTALSYPVSYPYYDPDGYFGMPFCFTHNVDMDYYGSSGWCVFLGWSWQSPQFLNEMANGICYSQFAYYVYYCMHWYGWSIGTTLDQLSQMIYGTSFGNSPLYNSLVVWGNMNMGLTY